MDINEEILNGVTTGFVNKLTHSIPEYQPKLLTNGKEETVLSTIEKQLETCDEFFFSVAFVTTEGVAIIKDLLLRRCGATIKYEGVKDGDEPKIKGKILVSEYQYFTQPEALQELLKIDNIELKIVPDKCHSHTKGYIFRHNEHYTLIIGSSNLTSGALKTNQEWNLCVSSTEHGSIVNEVKQEFDELFKDAQVVDDSYIEKYREIYAEHKKSRAKYDREFVESKQIVPNGMQERALKRLRELRSDGKNKALVISATGTGKTYLSAFDLQNFFKDEKIINGRFLFLVHRKKIAEAARETFKRVFNIPNGPGDITGLLSGDDKSGQGKQFIFSTIMTFSKDNILKDYLPHDFDYIVIDEAHRSAASSYDKIFKHFKPKFMLGMTATPERTDAHNIYELFDHNIACDIRLNDALEEHMVPPFHYYGVSDISVNGVEISDKDYKKYPKTRSVFNRLVCEERVKHIIRYSQFYGCDHGRIKGIIFCSRVEEAIDLSKMMNEEGFKTEAVSGDTKDKLNDIIDLLESDDPENYLDYVIAVELLNEGVDIPTVNQIIMLRPTQSAIIFVQQLGRGLRKINGKDYLTVIDFIGNYNNNYLVPIALFGDNSYNKDNLRKLVSTGSSLIPGESTIHFDRIALDRIFRSINSASINSKIDLENAYFDLKSRLGRIPMMKDFIDTKSRDPYQYGNVKFTKNKEKIKIESYYEFIEFIENLQNKLSEELKCYLKFFFHEICTGMRLEEDVILKNLCFSPKVGVQEIISQLKEKYGDKVTEDSMKISISSAINIINGNFFEENVSPFSNGQSFISYDGETIARTELFDRSLQSQVFKDYLLDNIEYSILTFMKEYQKNRANYQGGFILYNKYARRDIARILNWNNYFSLNQRGYNFENSEGLTCPIFVTYHKSKRQKDHLKYIDEFKDKDKQLFSWQSRRVNIDDLSNNKKSKERKTIDKIIYHKNNEQIFLFIIKSDKESSKKSDVRQFGYYMGEIVYKEHTISDEKINEKGHKTGLFNIVFELKTPVEDNLYHYITEV